MPSVSPRRSSSVAERTASKLRRLNQRARDVEADAQVARRRAGSARRRRSARRRAAAGWRAATACSDAAARANTCAVGADLDQPAALHHADPVGEAAHEVEVVGDEEERHAGLGLQLVEQGEDLRLDRHVERGRRLVGDEQLRPAGQRHGDHRPLPLPARELVRVGVDAPRRCGDAGALEQLDRARARRAPVELLVQRQHLADLRADRVQRIERGHRLLEDHRDLAAAHGAQLRLAPGAQVAAVEEDAPARGRAVDQAEHRERGDRLSGARLADEPELLSRGDRERDVVDRRRRAEADDAGARRRGAGSGARLRAGARLGGTGRAPRRSPARCRCARARCRAARAWPAGGPSRRGARRPGSRPAAWRRRARASGRCAGRTRRAASRPRSRAAPAADSIAASSPGARSTSATM